MIDTELEESRRTVMNLNRQLKEFQDTDKVATEIVANLENQIAKLNEQLFRSQDENQQLQNRCAQKEQVDAKVKMLEQELGTYINETNSMHFQIQRLRTVELDLNYFEEMIKEKENIICVQIATYNELEKSIATMRTSSDDNLMRVTQERDEYMAKFDEAEFQKAKKCCEFNQLNTKFIDLNESVRKFIYLITNFVFKPVKLINFLFIFFKSDLNEQLTCNLAEINQHLRSKKVQHMVELIIRDSHIKTLKYQLEDLKYNLNDKFSKTANLVKLKEKELSESKTELERVKTSMTAEIVKKNIELTQTCETIRKVKSLLKN